MWFIFITARLLIFLSFQPRLAATLLRSCSVVNSLTRRTGLSPAFQSASLAQQWVRFAKNRFEQEKTERTEDELPQENAESAKEKQEEF